MGVSGRLGKMGVRYEDGCMKVVELALRYIITQY